MNKQLSTNALVIFISLLGVCSSVTPASAKLTGIIKTVTNTTVTPVVENVTKTTSTVEVGKNVTATVQETTNTTVGQVAGASTDSTTTAKVDPSQILPSLTNPTELLQITGGAALGIQSNQQSTQADAQANLGVGIGDFATVGICLDANATLGILNQGSSANCPKDVETPPTVVETPPLTVETPPLTVETPPLTVETPPLKVETPPLQIEIPPIVVETPPLEVETPYVPIKIPPVNAEPNSVPEPTTFGGLVLLGVYFISRRRQIS
ncbi:PEP-CTERM sorting domain-containing protein [Nostoc punctiforme FACHB-252]|uniref:PEP-CTERM sorting domain-containing protein n=1 Tax=Nostoc punctiforme FACHB-252 TaxID=1357509 RepID=A0ABR8H7Y9_NOSPU|nr:PEP-CTERM sorting domain-containing protein [Nostoc punctiforme]MBD2611955.1 PEP-CTERM sorting domain-containing protein [Nostoc punctiforme FACHB-252]